MRWYKERRRWHHHIPDEGKKKKEGKKRRKEEEEEKITQKKAQHNTTASQTWDAALRPDGPGRGHGGARAEGTLPVVLARPRLIRPRPLPKRTPDTRC
eukprot:3198203-Rhodomonas_salina.1